MLPVMAGLTVSGIIVGQLVARTGRYRIFPIIGSAACRHRRQLAHLDRPGKRR